jgi:hypothetical protein
MCDQNAHKQFEEMLREHCAEYHNHKETMAHAALVVQLGLFAWIMTEDTWPPGWVNDVYIPSKWVAFTGYFIIWLLILLYTGWQLWHRRRGAKLVAALLNSIRKKIDYEPQGKIIQGYFRSISEQIKDRWYPKSDVFICLGSILILIFVFLRTLFNTSLDI